jgi:hypothetical protein
MNHIPDVWLLMMRHGVICDLYGFDWAISAHSARLKAPMHVVPPHPRLSPLRFAPGGEEPYDAGFAGNLPNYNH